MKPTTLIAIAAALGGFSLGWLVKPAGAPEQTAADTSAAGGKTSHGPDGRSYVRDEPTLVRPPRRGRAEPPTSEAQMQFQQTFASAGERTRNSRLNRLVEALGLDEEQKQAMDALLSIRRNGFRELQNSGKTATQIMGEAAAAEKGFETEVKKFLDEEQAQAYDEFKSRERENDVEARAAREFADLVGQVDLSPGQREQALAALRAASTDALQKRPDGWGLINESMDIMGKEYATAFDEMTGFLDDPAVMNDPAEIQKKMLEAKRKSSADKVSRLTGVLTPGQLSQYRAALDARSTIMESYTPPAVKNR